MLTHILCISIAWILITICCYLLLYLIPVLDSKLSKAWYLLVLVSKFCKSCLFLIISWKKLLMKDFLVFLDKFTGSVMRRHQCYKLMMLILLFSA